MSRLPIQRLTIGGPAPRGPAGPAPPGGWTSRREAREVRDGQAAERRERNNAGRLRSGGSKKGSAGRKSGIGRPVPRPGPSASRSLPSGPGLAAFPSVRLPNRSSQRSASQNARRSVFGSIGRRIRSIFGL